MSPPLEIRTLATRAAAKVPCAIALSCSQDSEALTACFAQLAIQVKPHDRFVVGTEVYLWRPESEEGFAAGKIEEEVTTHPSSPSHNLIVPSAAIAHILQVRSRRYRMMTSLNPLQLPPPPLKPTWAMT